MSRILIHSNAPWVPSGYGKQAGHLVRVLQELGHEVVFSAFSGLTGAPIEWNGVSVLPSGMYEYGIDVLIPHMDAVQPDLTIALMDVWKLKPIAEGLKGRNVAAWVPVDCTPLSNLDESLFKTSDIRPIAMSKFGEQQLRDAGLDPLYAPHVVDREAYRPLEADERKKYRAAMGIDDKFVIGMCAANNDAVRKGFPETFEAFRAFHKKHPNSVLRVHSIARSTRGLDLERLAGGIGLDGTSVQITDTYPQVSGMFDDSLMRDWYGVLDVLSCCSYAEAFGVPLIEAQACGTPVITTDGSAMPELRGPGWRVPGEPFYNHPHAAWWTRPNPRAITRAYEKALEQASRLRGSAREFTEGLDVRYAGKRWAQIVGQLCG